ncbi:MAG TPA: hypothetical protein VFJ81_02800 [Gemmatimonadales bacterium]|nr:hypothetical protein [Gemmatimonadales bacterium]
MPLRTDLRLRRVTEGMEQQQVGGVRCGFAHDAELLTDAAWKDLQQLRDKAAILTWRLARSLIIPK